MTPQFYIIISNLLFRSKYHQRDLDQHWTQWSVQL